MCFIRLNSRELAGAAAKFIIKTLALVDKGGNTKSFRIPLSLLGRAEKAT